MNDRARHGHEHRALVSPLLLICAAYSGTTSSASPREKRFSEARGAGIRD